MNALDKPRLYLAGPIRGVPDFAERFGHAAERLRAEGYRVFNPVEQDDAFVRAGTPVDIRHCLEMDLAWICRWGQGIALLPGWENSTGALAEHYTGRAIGAESWVLPPEYCK